jgi:hypothetical protein
MFIANIADPTPAGVEFLLLKVLYKHLTSLRDIKIFRIIQHARGNNS